MKNLVQRYVIARQKRGSEHNAVTEDDINEVKQEILSFKSDLIHILHESGMKAKQLHDNSAGVLSTFFKIVNRGCVEVVRPSAKIWWGS